MKKLLIGLCAALAMSLSFAAETPLEPQQACQTAEQAQTNSTPDQIAQQVLCCCNTSNGQCCKYVSMCSGYIPGCWCSGHAVEAEPTNSDASEGKVKI